MIDVDPEDNNKLRWIQSRHETPGEMTINSLFYQNQIKKCDKFSANMLISEEDAYANHEQIEISPKSSLIVKEVSERIVETGGAALICGQKLFQHLIKRNILYLYEKEQSSNISNTFCGQTSNWSTELQCGSSQVITFVRLSFKFNIFCGVLTKLLFFNFRLWSRWMSLQG